MSKEDKLSSFREKIDRLDRDILLALNERAQVAKEVGVIKGTSPKYRPEREAQIFRRLSQINLGPLEEEAVKKIFVEIISACRAMEDAPVVACLGPKGTFSEQAVIKSFGHSCQIVFGNTIDAVFKSVESRSASYGIVPVENSTEGAVARTLDLFVSSNLSICGEILLPIHHNLLTGVQTIGDIARVFSHAQSFGQCMGWLLENIPNAERVVVSSNAEAARLASINPDDSAAIGGVDAGETYNLVSLVRNIEDEADNMTRFVILGVDEVGVSKSDKTSFVMSTPSRPGALFGLLQPLADNGVNICRLESRPSKNGTWEYVFFIDIHGHKEDSHVELSLRQIKEKAGFLKVLGSYPMAEI